MKKPQKKRGLNKKVTAVITLVILVIAVIAAVIIYKKVVPTKETMSLEDYFVLEKSDDAAVILNGTYTAPDEGENANAKVVDGTVYIKYSYVRSDMDNGYFFDSTEGILRYVTDSDVITAYLESGEYLVNRDKAEWAQPIVMEEDDTVYLEADFMMQYTDFSYELKEDPARIVISTAGTAQTTGTMRRSDNVRRRGGNQSPILGTAEEGSTVIILEDYGSWDLVLTEDGIIGCVRENRITDIEETVVEANLEERTYEHKFYNGTVVLGWHNMTNTTANSNVSSVVEGTGINVISPTWFYMADNSGNIVNLASTDYVTYCHENDIQVWALFGSIEDYGADVATVLNTTSSRDTLVNNLIAAAITYDLDGINIDIEQLSNAAAGGYSEFIRELSLKCENNDIILSVDTNVPQENINVYNRTVLSDYYDYNIIMTYDEYTDGSTEAGSCSSINFVTEAAANIVEEVPQEQVIMALPFYTRVWTTASDGSLSNYSLGMSSQDSFLSENNVTAQWDEETQQYYAEFENADGSTVQVWLEEEESMAKKLEVYSEYQFAGLAFWRLGYETSEIWTEIESAVQ